jgi:hypothetical protein
MTTASTDLAALSDEELEQRRDALALDARHDPDLKSDLLEVEQELAARRLDAERDEAAKAEEIRRADLETQRRQAAEREEAREDFDRRGKSMAMAARTMEARLRDVVSMVDVLVGEANYREDAARRAGIEWSAMRIGSIAAGRVGRVLSRGGGISFSQFASGGPPGAYADPLQSLLGLDPPEDHDG